MKIRLLGMAVLVLALSGCGTPDLPVITTKKWDNVAGHLNTGITFPLKNMEAVQAFVNEVPYMSDEENYGVKAYWAPPKEFFRRRHGDCEDYAIAKYALGLENNLFKPEEAKLAEAWDLENGGQAHMLLIVRGKVYDNQIKNPFDLSGKEAERYRMLGVVDTRKN
jgi:predicted transglutaminase-like cysteine proteinase